MVVCHGCLMGTFAIQFITFDLPAPTLSDECSIAKAQNDFRQVGRRSINKFNTCSNYLVPSNQCFV